MVTVLDEVTRAVGDTHSAAGKTLEASKTVEAAPRAVSVALKVFLAVLPSDVRRPNPFLP
jgi:hypothetical protein